MIEKRKIYLDYASATPIDPKVLGVVREVEKFFWQNPSSIHEQGVKSAKMLQKYRENVARVLYAHADEIVFTSGGTEANNLAILGVVKNFKNKKPTILISSIDHPSTIEPAKSLADVATVKFLPVSDEGRLDLAFLKKELTKKPILVSFGYVNGEVGTGQDIKEIMKIVRHHRKVNKTQFPYVHIDATQAVSVLSCEVHRLGIDLMTLDGAKIYGPKGAGMLYVRRGLGLASIIYGGGQEWGLRPGTENLPAIAGFSSALLAVQKERERAHRHLLALRNLFIKKVLKIFPDAIINGEKTFRLGNPGIVNICFPGIDSEQAVLILDSMGIYVSASSSCQSLAERSNSYVVSALGKDKCALSSLRFSFGKFSKTSEIQTVISNLEKAVAGSKHKHFLLS